MKISLTDNDGNLLDLWNIGPNDSKIFKDALMADIRESLEFEIKRAQKAAQEKV